MGTLNRELDFKDFLKADFSEVVKTDVLRYFDNFKERLNAPYFTRGDIGVDLRKIYHWERNGLLPIANENREWREYTFLECIWILIIRELRNLNVNLEGIRSIKNKLFEPLPREYDFEAILYKLKELYPDMNELRDPNILEELNQLQASVIADVMKKNGLILLTELIYEAVSTRKASCILYNSAGEIGYINFDVVNISEKFNLIQQFFKSAFVSINLLEIIEKFLQSDRIGMAAYYDLNILTIDERKIIDLIRKGGIKEMTIMFKNGQIERAELKKTLNPKEMENKVFRVLKKGEYSKISIVSENGKLVNAEKTIKVKF
jgi:DNA-binding transcriptional MerR regulator